MPNKVSGNDSLKNLASIQIDTQALSTITTEKPKTNSKQNTSSVFAQGSVITSDFKEDDSVYSNPGDESRRENILVFTN